MARHTSNDKLRFLNRQDVLAALAVPYKNFIANFDRVCVQCRAKIYSAPARENENTDNLLQRPDYVLFYISSAVNYAYFRGGSI